MYKFLRVSFMLAMVAYLATTPITAFASNHEFGGKGHYFTNTADTYLTAFYKKTDNDGNWYISISKKSNLSEANIFGCRMHRDLGSDKDNVDYYHLISKKVKGYPFAYQSSVKKGQKMRMGYKKDSSSTTSKTLKVSGKFAP